jgi:hypothetical protein
MSLARFAYWLIEVAELPHEVTDGCCRVKIPEDAAAELSGRQAFAFCLDDCPSGKGEASCSRLTAEEPFFQWLCRRAASLREGSFGAIDARPCHDPRSVYELTARLFPRYRVEGGRVHLSGCTLEDRPFLRLTYPARDNAAEITHYYFAPDGTPVDCETRQALGLMDVCDAHPSPSQQADSQVDLLIAAGRRIVESHALGPAATEAPSADPPLATTVVWVKHAQGKLQFTIAEESVQIGFEGWARAFEPPPFVCPYTGIQSHHLAACDDGRISAAEAIEKCAQTGRRVLATELVTCSVTNKRVLPQCTRPCPVTGKPALADQFEGCSLCHQQVSRAAIAGAVCEGCRNLAITRADDPRVAWFLGEYPRLGRWGHWKLSETASQFIVTGTRLVGRILIVFDKETLAPQYAATCGRFRKAWLELDQTEQQDLFGENAKEKPE